MPLIDNCRAPLTGTPVFEFALAKEIVGGAAAAEKA